MSDYEVTDPAGMGPTQRLHMLGIELPEPAAPAGAYVGHVVSGDLLFTAGQLPFVDGELLATGLVGDTVDVSTAQHCARQAVINVLAQVRASGRRLEDVRRIVKVTVFVASAAGFTEQPEVADGASELLGEVFGEAGQHARSAIGTAVLPRNSPVEVEAVIEVAHR